MRVTNVIFAIGLLALSANIFAEARSSDIKLKDMLIKPTQSQPFAFDKLLSQVNYTVTCMIMSDGISNQSEDILQMRFNNERVFIGDEQIYSGQAFTMATGKPIVMTLEEVYWGNSFVDIRNLDDTDTISVTNCVAKPYHN